MRRRGASSALAVCGLCGLIAVAILGQAARAEAAGSGATLEIDRGVSADGVYQLSWQVEGEARVEESSTPDFADPVVVYEGLDNATTLSGRVDGVYYYRVVPTGSGGVASPVVSVDVAHHPLSRALAFFGVGLAVFVAIVAVIVGGNAREARA